MPSTPFNTIVYIDGFNLYHSLKDTPYKWLNIEALISSVLDSSLNNIIKIKYFTVSAPFSESAQRQDLYLRVVDTLQKVEIIYGKFKKRHIKIRKNYVEKLCIVKGDFKKLTNIKSILRENIVQFSKHEEKETDVNIATHIIYDCCKENIDSIKQGEALKYNAIQSAFNAGFRALKLPWKSTVNTHLKTFLCNNGFNSYERYILSAGKPWSYFKSYDRKVCQSDSSFKQRNSRKNH